MKMKTFALLTVLMALAVPARAQDLVYLVRHAERADAGQMTPEADPKLSAAGEARAARLAAMLKDAGVTTILVTEYRRTKATAAPLAAATGLAEQAIPARDSAGLLSAIHADAHGVVLVVGHSNTIPAVIKALGGPDVTMGENEYDALFVFVPATGRLSRIRY